MKTPCPTCIMFRILLLGYAIAAISCVSPEATRSRGEGRGADVGNRKELVQMHAGSDPFWKTPDRIGRTAHPPLDPARQARAYDEDR